MYGELFDPEEVPATLRQYFEEVETTCGVAWRRVVERDAIPEEAFSRGTPSAEVRRRQGDTGQKHVPGARRHLIPPATTTGWAPQCHCNAPVRPQLVLDPFLGSGTTAAVAHELGRDWIGLDLDERALKWTADRLAKYPVGLLPGLVAAGGRG